MRAGPDGARRPCSHSCSVRTETPSNRAKSTCERPTRALVSATGGNVTTRPTSPRLISRMPSRISAPMSRVRFLAIFNLPPNLPQDVGWDVLCDVLWIKRQHPDHALTRPQVVDDTEPTAFPAAGKPPPELADAARLGNDRSSFRIFREGCLQLEVLI